MPFDVKQLLEVAAKSVDAARCVVVVCRVIPSILINCTPKIMSYAINLDEYFIDEEGIAISLGVYSSAVSRISIQICCTKGELLHNSPGCRALLIGLQYLGN